MKWLSYLPGRSALLLLFRIARKRLIATNHGETSLSNARLTTATQEINHITEDIHAAERAGPAAEPVTPSPATASSDDNPDQATLDDVAWSGETNVMASTGERSAFVARLVGLGYSPADFRVRVSRLTPEDPDDTRLKYYLRITQLENGKSCREHQYCGGGGLNWVEEFGRDALLVFPPGSDVATDG